MEPTIWAEIDLDAIASNVRELRRITRANARIMAVVKANAYGHGSEAVARTALANGADCLGVARIGEALALRDAGFEVPILIFGRTPPSLAPQLAAHDLTATLYDLPSAMAYSESADSRGETIRIHLKVDTGMGRLGILPDSLRPKHQKLPAVQEVLEISRLPGLEIEGIYTHFATADSADKSYARYQLEEFRAFLTDLQQAGLEFSVCHAANSAAIIELPEAHFDMVRPGISLYGLPPSADMDLTDLRLIPAMTLKAKIVHVKSVDAGFKVSYGATWEAPAPTIIATVAVGYADGYSRLLSNRGNMLVRGRKAPIAGRVCMDQTMLDVGHIPEVQLGDEVVIIGRQQNEAILADDIAAEQGTINYEVVSSIMARVPRIYK
ncbi:Alanine racemase (EC [Olavius algarvensis associated proteobacterium Delta 3]|nr:Alanine racemase (EC [Olavius algarvensis associated proteobacterium Delta 3]